MASTSVYDAEFSCVHKYKQVELILHEERKQHSMWCDVYSLQTLTYVSAS